MGELLKGRGCCAFRFECSIFSVRQLPRLQPINNSNSNFLAINSRSKLCWEMFFASALERRVHDSWANDLFNVN